MINDNLSFKFSNLDGENNSTSDKLKRVSIAELLAGDNHDEHEEHHEYHEHHEHDFASSDSTSDSDGTSASAAVVKPATTDIVVNYHGFTEEAENAFEYAVTIWEGWIKSDPDIELKIEVDAYWTDLSGYGSNVLGAASPNGSIRNFMDSDDNEDYQDNTFYAMSLANHLAGEDLNGGSAEINAWFNSEFSKWYFGTDGNTPNGKYDFTTVVLHELGHGFGLTDFIDYNDGIGSYGNTIFESFIVNGDNQSLDTFANHSKELGKELTSNDLYFNGPNATAANGGKKVKLYAPSKWKNGSSIAHLDEKTYPKGDEDSLMTPYLKAGEVIHNPGAITLGLLEDLGWDINKVDSQPVSPEADALKEEPAPTQPVETPSTTILALDFNFLKSYGGQDGKHTLNIFDDGKKFEVEGNSWKQLEIDYNITEDTILEFDFRSDKEGEIQGIGFDTDNKFNHKVDNKYLFQLSGTQKLGISEFEYQTNSDWQSYQIRVGDYFTGDFKYLTFANDHDKGTKDAHSQFRNLRLYEEGQEPQPKEEPAPTQPEETPSAPKEEPAPTQPVETPSTTIPTLDFNFLKSYGGQDGKHTLNVSADGKEFEVKGNSWKQLEIDYNITEDTILEFDFRSDKEGEIQGIGFDTDNNFNHKVDNKYLFQLSGTQKLGLSEFEYQTDSGWQSYQIRVSDYFTGDFKYLTFANDHDKGTKDAHSQFRNLRLYEEGHVVVPTLDFNPLESYGGQDGKHTLNISDDGKEFEVEGNSWKQLEIGYNITKDTILEFDFKSDKEGEIQGIGFDTDNNFNHKVDKKYLFQLSGTQKLGISEFEYQTDSGWQSYQIRVGDYFIGDFSFLTFANDHDNGTKDAHSQFRNLRLYEDNTSNFSLAESNSDLNSDVLLTVKDSTNSYNIFSYGGTTQDKGTFSISDDDKTEVTLEGNTWKKLDINNYNITENTVLKFDFQTTAKAEIQGIGFDNDDIIDGGDRTQFFKVSGTQDWGIELEDSYTLGSGWQTYEIKVGDFFTGKFDYLTLASDNDDSNSTVETQFRNISLSEM